MGACFFFRLLAYNLPNLLIVFGGLHFFTKTQPEVEMESKPAGVSIIIRCKKMSALRNLKEPNSTIDAAAIIPAF